MKILWVYGILFKIVQLISDMYFNILVKVIFLDGEIDMFNI